MSVLVDAESGWNGRMMYRCGWATKPGQERALSVEHVYPLPNRIADGLNASPDVGARENPERQHQH
ncbi:hypothetical protein ACQP0I_30785 [Micromonospora carbonacea]|uniref:hypothetical protein n=1 Tax=Micromonospora carbonacea TaxID=47853 RepID=UPI003D97C7AD